MNEREKKIQEQRTIEATKKGFMGLSGKFGIILKNLGEPIVSHSSGEGSMSSSYLDDPWLLPGESNEFDQFNLPYGDPQKMQASIPYMDMPGQEPVGYGWKEQRNANRIPIGTSEIGWIFDGLNRGIHMEIKYTLETSDLVVYFKGYEVYREIGGELYAYSPNEEWEPKVERLYAIAKEKEQKKGDTVRTEQIQVATKNKEQWVDKIKKRWGIT